MKKHHLYQVYVFALTGLLLIAVACKKHNSMPPEPSGKVTATIGGLAFSSDTASAGLFPILPIYLSFGGQGVSYLEIDFSVYTLNDTIPFGNNFGGSQGLDKVFYSPTGDSAAVYRTIPGRSSGYYTLYLQTYDSLGGHFTGWVYNGAGDSLDITNGSFLFVNPSTISVPSHI